MSLDLIVGKATKEGHKLENGSTVLSIYLGNRKGVNDTEDNHVNVSVFINSSNKTLAKLAVGDVVIVKGRINSRKNKSGFIEVTMNATSLQIAGASVSPHWGYYPSKAIDVFISAIFRNRSGGYEASCTIDDSFPVIRKNEQGESFVEFKNDDRNLRFNIPKTSFAFKQVNNAIRAITGIELNDEQASEEQLEALRKMTARVELGMCSIKAVKSNIENINGYNFYINNNALSVMFLRQIGNSANPAQKAAVNAPAQQNQPSGQQPQHGNQFAPDSNAPFGSQQMSQGQQADNISDNPFDGTGFDNDGFSAEQQANMPLIF